MSRFVDSLIAYRILRMLVIPFKDTDAYALGIIDERGKELKKMQDLNSVAEKDAYTILHRMIYRIKKIIEKVPIENKKLASFAAALALIKENQEHEPIDLEHQFLLLVEQGVDPEYTLQVEQFFSGKMLTFSQFYEEAPANNAAATPGVAGFTPETLGVKKKKKNTIFRRGAVHV